MQTPIRLLPCLALLGVIACATTAAGPDPSEQPPETGPRAPTDAELEGLPIFDGHSGEARGWPDLLAKIDSSDIVVLGELHGHPVGLPFDARLLALSLPAQPQAALCLEFLTRDGAYILDAYQAGLIDWAALEEAMSAIPGCNPLPHRPLIDLAIANHIPVIAANAPRLYTRAAKAKGFEALAALNAEQQRLFDLPSVLPSGPYREGFFRMMMGDHGADLDEAGDADESSAAPEPSQAVKDKFRAQALWDGTMSTSVARAYEAGKHPVFLVVGSYHCNNDGGTVQLLRERNPDARISVISFVDADSNELRDEDQDLADFVVYVGPYPES